MANRKWHTNGAVVVYVLVVVVFFVLDEFRFSFKRDAAWLTVGFLMALMGGWFPDIDQTYPSKLHHRDWFTHSAIVPVILSALALWGGDFNIPFVPVIALFNLAVASHLLLDYFPSWKSGGQNKEKDIEDLLYGFGWVIEGFTGKEVVQKLEGTYLIHLWWKTKERRKTLETRETRLYLITNGLILFFIGVGMLIRFIYLTYNLTLV